MSNTNPLSNLAKWYESHCDGKWEHAHRIKIQTIDNPGFSVEINLIDTGLEKIDYVATEVEYEGDWINTYKSKEMKWVAACSPNMLNEVISLFLKWSQSIQRPFP
jgi:hypothetical protein